MNKVILIVIVQKGFGMLTKIIKKNQVSMFSDKE